MSTVSTKPIAVLGTPTGITTVGAGSAWAALSDSDNASYIKVANQAVARFTIGIPGGAGQPIIPVGENVALIRMRLKTNRVMVGAPETNQAPRLHCVLGGTVGRPLPGRPWDGLGMETVTRVWWEVITLANARGDFPASGLPIALSPTALNLTILRDEAVNDYEARVYEVYVDTVYAPKPKVTVVKPTGTISLSATPEVRWDATLPTVAGPQTHYQVKIYDDTRYVAGGFNVNTTTPVQEQSASAVPSANRYFDIDNPLIDENYRCYVRVAQTLHGVRIWSDWGWKSFVIGTPRPGLPTFTLTPEHTSARMRINITGTVGGETTECFQIQRSLNGTTGWAGVRTSLGYGLMHVSGASPFNAVVYDYEGLNNQVVYYRVRSVSTDNPPPKPGEPFGNWFVYSAWAANQSSKWQDSRWWFKHPFDSTLNLAREVRSQPGRARAARAEVFQPLGRTDAIAVSDTLTPWSGELVIRNNTDAERLAFDTLIATGLPIILHAPYFVPDWDTIWVHVSEHSRERMVDNQNFLITWDKITWTKVARPLAPQPDNPVIPPETDPTSALAATNELNF